MILYKFFYKLLNYMSIPKLVFLIPYRNREQQKLHFEIYMKYIMEDFDKSDYEIYFVHQCDSRNFNRGAIKNIGFLAIKNKYPNHYKNITFVFNDIDTLPFKKNLLNYQTNKGVIKHFFGFNFALGGIFSITGYDFELIKGFPNLWAWGLEDNTLNYRAKNKNIIVDRSNFFPFFDQNIIHLNDSKGKILSKENSWRFKENNLDTVNDLKHVKYEFNNEYINVKTFNTKLDPREDNYYYSENNSRISFDSRFIPKDSKYKLKNMNFYNR